MDGQESLFPYRSWSAVNVRSETNKFPDAEILFPIAAQHLNATRAFGVLNMELFADRFYPDAFVATVPREEVNEFLCNVLDVHAGFLKVAIDIFGLLQDCRNDLGGGEEYKDFSHVAYIESHLVAHRVALKLLFFRDRRKLERLKDKLDRLGGDIPECPDDD